MTTVRNRSETVTVAMTGASGAPYAVRLLQQLAMTEQQIWVMLSDAARTVLAMEVGWQLSTDLVEAERQLQQWSGAAEGQLQLFGREEWLAPVASGSGAPRAMVVCPCSMGSLAAIAHGNSDHLLERAADVMLKERRQLILVPRESPYSTIHLENMTRLSRLGAVLLPASPGFYHQPGSVEDLVDFVVARILDQLGLEQQLLPAWGEGHRRVG